MEGLLCVVRIADLRVGALPAFAKSAEPRFLYVVPLRLTEKRDRTVQLNRAEPIRPDL